MLICLGVRDLLIDFLTNLCQFVLHGSTYHEILYSGIARASKSADKYIANKMVMILEDDYELQIE
jgi:hypothetical protein